MAFINLIIIEKEKIRIQKVSHYFVLRILNKKLTNIQAILQTLDTTLHLDDGYFLIDINQRIMLSNQSAFASSHIDPEARQYLWKNWNYIEEL